MSDELKSSPDLDRRVCEILGIETDGGETFDPNEPAFPRVSSDPATIPVVMEGISEADFKRQVERFKREYGRDPSLMQVQRNNVCLKYLPYGGTAGHWAQLGEDHEYGDSWSRGATLNLALCGLALKLGEPTTKRSEP